MLINSFKNEISHKKTLLFFSLALLLLIIGSIVHFNKTTRIDKNDFNVYYKTAERIKTGDWGEIYTRNDGAFPYRYVPYTLMGVSWLGAFQLEDARKVWLVVQVLTFVVGFFYLYRSLILLKVLSPLLIVSLTFLFTYRQYLDSLYSGQVAGMIFLSLSLGLYFYLKKHLTRAGIVSSVAASLKILPGFLLIYGIVKSPSQRQRMKFIISGVTLFIFLNALILIWLKFYQAEHHFFNLWKTWWEIVLADGEYFDGSTPKSQSLRGAILRLFGKNEMSEVVSRVLVSIGSLLLIFHWIRNKTTDLFQNAYSYCLGILAFILFMPESLPYQMVNVAIPLLVLISHPKMKTDRLYQVMLVLFVFIIGLASTDLIGRNNSDWLQAKSLAFWIMCLMSFILVRDSRTMNQVVKT